MELLKICSIVKSYYEYLKACAECVDEIYSESDYERVASRFKNFDVDFNNYNPYDHDFELYVLDTLLWNKFGSDICVDYINGDDVSIDCDGIQSADVLNDIKKFLESLGYNFKNYESLEKEINEKIEEDERDKVYDEARDIICYMSTNELKEFIEWYGARN